MWLQLVHNTESAAGAAQNSVCQQTGWINNNCAELHAASISLTVPELGKSKLVLTAAQTSCRKKKKQQTHKKTKPKTKPQPSQPPQKTKPQKKNHQLFNEKGTTSSKNILAHFLQRPKKLATLHYVLYSPTQATNTSMAISAKLYY